MMLGVVVFDGSCESGANDSTAEVDVETESETGTVSETGTGLAAGSNAEPEASGATVDESTDATAATSADTESVDWTAALAGMLLVSVAGNVLDGSEMAGVVSVEDVDFGTSTGTVTVVDSITAAAVTSILVFGTVMSLGGGAVICAAGVGDKEGSKLSEGTAGFIRSEPGPETDNKSERSCCWSTGLFCRLGVGG